MDLAFTIDQRLQASGSTGPTCLTRSERGILSEFWVARDRSGSHAEILLAHRQKTPFAEIDLLFESADRSALHLIEVKSCAGEIWGPNVISKNQLLRLERARTWLEARENRLARLLLAVVQTDASRPVISYFDHWV
jgi:Holliday junction resolvase-like predicted endonuclease